MKMISIDAVMEILREKLEPSEDEDGDYSCMLEEVQAALEQEWYLENPRKAYAPDVGT